MGKVMHTLPPPLEETVPAEVFKAEVHAWAQRIGAAPTEIRLRPMKRKWASCSSKGRLTFNTELLRERAAFRAKVIVHELLHLQVPNHGRLHKALLRAWLSQADDQRIESLKSTGLSE